MTPPRRYPQPVRAGSRRPRPAHRRPTRWTPVRALTVLLAALVAAGLATGAVSVLAFGAARAGLPVLPGMESCTFTAGSLDAVSVTPEQAGNAATIVGVAGRLGLPPRASVIALATAVQESGLRNLDHGDRDSLGLFQQRPSQGWGTPTQLQDPVYATEKFYEGLAGVPDYEDLPVTVAAQTVQRSAFPDAYAAHEPMAETMTRALTGARDAAISCDLLTGAAAGLLAPMRCEPATQPGRPVRRLSCQGATSSAPTA